MSTIEVYTDPDELAQNGETEHEIPEDAKTDPAFISDECQVPEKFDAPRLREWEDHRNHDKGENVQDSFWMDPENAFELGSELISRAVQAERETAVNKFRSEIEEEASE